MTTDFLQWLMIIALGIGSLAHSWCFRSVRRRSDIHEEILRNAVTRNRS